MIQIIPVQKTDNDAKLIMTWRNDETTRKNSINKNVKEWNTFKIEFYENYFNNIPLFALLDNKKIAFISFVKIINNNYKIGINIAPEYRGKKLSSKIINKAIKYIQLNYSDIQKIFAEIKDFNIPSIKTFLKSGFTFKEKRTNLNTYLFNIIK